MAFCVLFFVLGLSAAEARREREEHRLHSWTGWGFQFQPCCSSDGFPFFLSHSFQVNKMGMMIIASMGQSC